MALLSTNMTHELSVVRGYVACQWHKTSELTGYRTIVCLSLQHFVSLSCCTLFQSLPHCSFEYFSAVIASTLFCHDFSCSKINYRHSSIWVCFPPSPKQAVLIRANDTAPTPLCRSTMKQHLISKQISPTCSLIPSCLRIHRQCFSVSFGLYLSRAPLCCKRRCLTKCAWRRRHVSYLNVLEKLSMPNIDEDKTCQLLHAALLSCDDERHNHV